MLNRDATLRPFTPARVARRHPIELHLSPSSLTEAEIVRRFTRATEILLVGYARYQKQGAREATRQEAAQQGELS
jgi:hypothetical protein